MLLFIDDVLHCIFHQSILDSWIRAKNIGLAINYRLLYSKCAQVDFC